MDERENENHQPLVVDMQDDTIVFHSVPPKPFETICAPDWRAADHASRAMVEALVLFTAVSLPFR